MKFLLVQSDALTFDHGPHFHARLDKLVHKIQEPMPICRPKDTIASDWSCRLLKRPWIERRVPTAKALLENAKALIVLMDSYEKDDDIQEIIEAAEDRDLKVKILRREE